MKLTRARVKLSIFLLILAGTALWIGTINVRARRAVTKYKAHLLAQGEKLSVSEVMPPFLPDSQNSAGTVREVIALLNKKPGLLDTNPPRAMRMVAPGKAVVGWMQPEIHDETTNTWDEIQSAIEAEQDTLALLGSLIERPNANFNLDYSQGFSLLLPHLAPMKKATQLLVAAALCDLHRNDAASATIRIRAMLGLVRCAQGDRLVISQLVSLALAQIALTASWELLNGSVADGKNLETLQRDWEGLQFAKPMEQSLVMERALVQAMTAELRRSAEGYRKMANSMSWSSPAAAPSSSGDWLGAAGDLAKVAWEQARKSTGEAMWRYSWSYPDELRSLQGYQAMLDALRSVQSGFAFKAAMDTQVRRLKELGIVKETSDGEFPLRYDNFDTRFLVSQGVEALQRVQNNVLRAEASRQLMVTAIAIKRYQLKHGAVPSALADLAPEFVAATTRDPVDGNPLRYRKTGEATFTLYSIGQDGVDDGGDSSPPGPSLPSSTLPWTSRRDIVLPTPASTEEIAAFYDKEKKKRFNFPAPPIRAPQTNLPSTNSSN